SAGDECLAIVSYDEKPGIQAIGTTVPDRPPLPGKSPTVMRDHEYKRHGTLTLMAGIDLLTGHLHALVKERHRSREFIEFLKLLDAAYSRSSSTTIPPMSRARPQVKTGGACEMRQRALDAGVFAVLPREHRSPAPRRRSPLPRCSSAPWP